MLTMHPHTLQAQRSGTRHRLDQPAHFGADASMSSTARLLPSINDRP